MDFDDFFNGIVKKEEHKDDLDTHNKTIHRGDISKEFQCSEFEVWDTATSCWVLKDQSVLLKKTM